MPDDRRDATDPQRPPIPRPAGRIPQATPPLREGDWEALAKQTATIAAGLYREIPTITKAVERLETAVGRSEYATERLELAVTLLSDTNKKLEANVKKLDSRVSVVEAEANGDHRHREKVTSAHDIAEELFDRFEEREKTNPGVRDTVTTSERIHEVVRVALTEKQLKEREEELERVRREAAAVSSRVWRLAFSVLGFVFLVLSGVLVWDFTLRGH